MEFIDDHMFYAYVRAGREADNRQKKTPATRRDLVSD